MGVAVGGRFSDSIGQTGDEVSQVDLRVDVVADADLIGLAADELSALGLVDSAEVEEGFVIRQPKAYPVYDEGYEERVKLIQSWLEKNMPGLLFLKTKLIGIIKIQTF